MAKRRAEFFKGLEANDPSAITSLANKHFSRADAFDLTEFVQHIPKKDFNRLWDSISAIAQGALSLPSLLSQEEEIQGSQEEINEKIGVLRASTLFARTYIADPKNPTTDSLFFVVKSLHDTLTFLGHESTATLSNEICLLCEKWWAQNRTNKNEIAACTMLVLTCKALQGSATDVARLYAFREALALLDMDSEDSSNMRDLLLHCAINPTFLKRDDGRKFIVFLFSLDGPFIDDLHEALKNHMPYFSRSLHEAVGEVYLKAWRAASGSLLHKIETSCIQDFMHHAIHSSNPSLFKGLRLILDAFHSEKKSKGVDEMLSRLYGPILWRSMKVANPTVRKQAATVFMDAFPVQDLEAPSRVVDEEMQKQLNCLQSLLTDKAPVVRVVGVQAVCRVLAVYWELIPQSVITSFIMSLVNEMAHDASSSAVRTAVFQGLSVLLDNHLSHSILKPALPKLGCLIDDSADQVRNALVNLLITVKPIKAIRFFDIVPLESLLKRMEVDSGATTKRITKLLLNSFFPYDADSATQLTRCISMLKMNTDAAKLFFSQVHLYSPLGSVCKLIVAVYRGLCQAADTPSALETSSLPSKRTKRKARDVEQEECLVGGVDGLNVSDTALVTDLFEIMAVAWQSISHKVNSQNAANKPLYEYLVKHFSLKGKLVDELVDALNLESAEIRSAVLTISSHLPFPGTKASNSTKLLSQLQQFEGAVPVDEFGHIIDCLCDWKLQDKVMDHITTSIEALVGDVASKPAGKPKKRTRESSSSPAERHAIASLQFLNYILAKEKIRDIVGIDSTSMERVVACLKEVLECMKSKLSDESSLQHISGDFFLAALMCYLKVLLYSVVAANPEDRDKTRHPPIIGEFLHWVADAVVPAVKIHGTPTGNDLMSPPAVRSKSKTSKKSTPFSLLSHTLELVIAFSTELVTLDMSTEETSSNMVTFVKSLLTVAGDTLRKNVMPYLSKLIFQLVDSGDTPSAAALLDAVLDKVEPQETQALKPLLAEVFSSSRVLSVLSMMENFVNKMVVAQMDDTIEEDIHPLCTVMIQAVVKSPHSTSILLKEFIGHLHKCTQKEGLSALQLIQAFNEAKDGVISTFGYQDELRSATRKLQVRLIEERSAAPIDGKRTPRRATGDERRMDKIIQSLVSA